MVVASIFTMGNSIIIDCVFLYSQIHYEKLKFLLMFGNRHLQVQHTLIMLEPFCTYFY